MATQLVADDCVIQSTSPESDSTDTLQSSITSGWIVVVVVRKTVLAAVLS